MNTPFHGVCKAKNNRKRSADVPTSVFLFLWAFASYFITKRIFQLKVNLVFLTLKGSVKLNKNIVNRIQNIGPGRNLFLNLQLVGWVDIFSRKIYKDIVIDSLKFCQENKGLEIFSYVIMSNHIQILCRSNTGDLSGTIRDFKNFTSKKFLEVVESDKESRKDWMIMVFKFHAKFKKDQNYQIWTHENHAEHIYSQKFIEQKIKYIHENPVRSGIVQYPQEYVYSSAKNYADEESLLELTIIDFLWKTVH